MYIILTSISWMQNMIENSSIFAPELLVSLTVIMKVHLKEVYLKSRTQFSKASLYLWQQLFMHTLIFAVIADLHINKPVLYMQILTALRHTASSTRAGGTTGGYYQKMHTHTPLIYLNVELNCKILHESDNTSLRK